MVCFPIDPYDWSISSDPEMEEDKASSNLREESIRASNSDVQDEVERLIERSVGLTSLRPWIVKGRIVDDVPAKLASVPHVLVAISKGDEEYLLGGYDQ